MSKLVALFDPCLLLCIRTILPQRKVFPFLPELNTNTFTIEPTGKTALACEILGDNIKSCANPFLVLDELLTEVHLRWFDSNNRCSSFCILYSCARLHA